MKQNRNLLLRAVTVLILLAGLSACRSGDEAPRNIILFIADGCGFNHMASASLFVDGRPHAQVYYSFPVQYAMSTHSASGKEYDPQEAWKSFRFVEGGPTDSAAAATALSTGVKTYNGAINVDMDENPLLTICEEAERIGKSTGVVTSVYFSHATPAAFGAHNTKRSRYLEISQEMILESSLDVIMGCGHPLFDKQGNPVSGPNYRNVGGPDTWQALCQGTAGGDADNDGIPDYWTLVETRDAFVSLISGPTPPRVIGVPQVSQTLQQQRSGDGHAAPFEEPMIETVPDLREMTLAALNVLSRDKDGFLLMVEGGAVDWAAHDNQTGRMIEEQMDFDLTVAAVVQWVGSHSRWKDTLIIVTSDHETGYLTGPDSGPVSSSNGARAHGVWNPLINRGKGRTPGLKWNIDGHTNSLVPFFARGAGSRRFEECADQKDPIRGPYLDNAEVGRVLRSLLQSP